MFSFTKEQQELEIGSIHIGGQPGHYPTVLFGGLFFKGEPEIEKAEKQLNTMYRISKKTGVPAIPDLFFRKESTIDQIISFIESSIPDPLPFSVDIQDSSVKIMVLERLKQKRLLHRTIFNSIHIGITDEEYQCLKRCKPAMAVVVAFNPKDKSPDGKVEVLETGAHLIDKGLLDLVNSIGIQNVLIDTAALAPGENSGAALASLPVIKEEYGLPAGCAIHNVVEKSSWLNEMNDAKLVVDFASNSGVTLFGGDFLLFGPIDHAEMVFPIIAWHDILVSEYTEAYFGITPSESHPRRLLSK